MNESDIVGTYILHNKNGISSIGKVICITEEKNSKYLKVQFENVEKSFPFPDIVAPKYNFNFLFIDKDVQKYVENRFIEKYSVTPQKTANPKIYNNNADPRLEQIIKIFDEIKIDFSTVIDLLFDKIIKEHSISFLYDTKPLVCGEKIFAPPILQNNYAPNYKTPLKITKKIAINKFREKGYYRYLNNSVTFASKNSVTPIYWANPNFSFLKKDWTIILNDIDKEELYMFFIPANSITANCLIPRNDKRDIIDLQISYGDPNFTDTRSNFAFGKYLIAKIDKN